MADWRTIQSAAKERLRGHLSPQLLKFRRQTFAPRDALVISGYFRSGTTWLAERLATAANAGIVFEPFHIENVPDARDVGLAYVNYRHPDLDWPEGKEFVDRIMRGRLLNPWTAGHIPLRDALKIERLVVKLVSSNQMLVWLARNVDVQPPVMLIRHPCAVLASWISRGWRLNDWIMRDDALLESFPEIEAVVDSLRSPEQIFAARWCIDHYAPLLQRRGQEFRVVAFEKLVRDGESYLRDILSHWGVEPSEDGLSGLRKPSGKASSDVIADYTTVIGGWKRRLSDAQIADVLDVVRTFGLDFYGEDPEPDYERLFSPSPARRMATGDTPC